MRVASVAANRTILSAFIQGSDTYANDCIKISNIFLLFIPYLKGSIFRIVFGLLPHFEDYHARYPLLAYPLGEPHLYQVISITFLLSLIWKEYSTFITYCQYIIDNTINNVIQCIYFNTVFV